MQTKSATANRRDPATTAKQSFRGGAQPTAILRIPPASVSRRPCDSDPGRIVSLPEVVLLTGEPFPRLQPLMLPPRPRLPLKPLAQCQVSLSCFIPPIPLTFSRVAEKSGCTCRLRRHRPKGRKKGRGVGPAKGPRKKGREGRRCELQTSTSRPSFSPGR